jgi:hypothetical protein
MQFDDFEVNDDELNERLSSWRRMPGVVSQSALQSGVTSANIEEVRTRQRRIATMCLNTVQAHDAFVGQLKDFLGNGQHRDPMYQQREEDEAAFALGVFEQTTALSLELGIKRELEGLPKEVIQTITVPAPPPPRSWFQRMLGI